jgi:hypothetical protein
MSRTTLSTAVIAAILSALLTSALTSQARAQTPPSSAVCISGLPVEQSGHGYAQVHAAEFLNDQLAAGRTHVATIPLSGTTTTVTCFW